MPAAKSNTALSSRVLANQIRHIARGIGNSITCLNACRDADDIATLYNVYDDAYSYSTLYHLLADYVVAAKIYFPDDAFRSPIPHQPTEGEIRIADEILGSDMPDLMACYIGSQRLMHTMMREAFDRMHGIQRQPTGTANHYQNFHLFRKELGLPNKAENLAPLVDVPENNYHSVDRTAALELIVMLMDALPQMLDCHLAESIERNPKLTADFEAAGLAAAAMAQEQMEKAIDHIMRQSGLEAHVVEQYVQVTIAHRRREISAQPDARAKHYN